MAPHTLGSCLRLRNNCPRAWRTPSFLPHRCQELRVPSQAETQSSCLYRALQWVKCWAFMEEKDQAGPTQPCPLRAAGPSLGRASAVGPRPLAMRRSEWPASEAGGSALGHTGDTRHEQGEPCWVRANSVPFRPDSQGGRCSSSSSVRRYTGHETCLSHTV